MNVKDFRLWLPLLLMACVMSALIVYYVDGVRGTDQYWYLADTETAIVGQTELTNTVFPGMLLRQNNSDPVTHFIHNGPLITLNAVLGSRLGAFNAWKYSNLFFYLSAAVFTGLATSLLCGSRFGAVATVLYLTNPSHVWLAGNLLQESFYAFLTAVLLFLVLKRASAQGVGWLMLPVFFVGTLAHPIYAAFGLLFSIFLLIERKNVTLALLSACVVLLANHYKTAWYPSSFQPDFMSIVASSVPGLNNTIWQLSDVLPELTPELMWAKFYDALKMHFFTLNLVPLYLTANVGLLCLVFLLAKQRKSRAGFLMVACLSCALYAALIVLMQNQFRYQLLISPVIIATVALAFSYFDRPVLLKLFGAVVLTYIVFDVVLLKRINIDSIQESQSLAFLSEELAEVPLDARVAIVVSDSAAQIGLSVSLNPRKSMLIDTDLLPADKISLALLVFAPDIVLADSKWEKSEGDEFTFVKTLQPPTGVGLDFHAAQ